MVALNQMHPLKSLGPDGLPVMIFQKYWGIIDNDVLELVLRVLNNGLDPSGLNKTFIALIPKCKKPYFPKRV